VRGRKHRHRKCGELLLLLLGLRPGPGQGLGRDGGVVCSLVEVFLVYLL
jgi:hypothetical protein